MTAKRSKRPETGGEPDEFGPAYARALNLVAWREHSAQELRAKLVRRGISSTLTDAVVEGLVENGLLNESRFVECFVQSRVERGYGPLKINAELQARGIQDGLPAQSIDWVALAQGARVRRFGAEHPRDYRERARQMRFLQQRGFDGNQISAVFKGIDD